MGNDMDMGLGFGGGWCYGVDRRGWKAVSDSARQTLESAKDIFRDFVKQTSFRNIDDESFEYTKKQAIQLHLVGKLRPEFNRYVKKFGAKAKWNKLTAMQKRSTAKYKTRSSAIYFCDLSITKAVRDKLFELEPDTFSKELLLTEIALYTRLKHMGVPECVALGWIVSTPKSQKEKIPKIQHLQQFLDEEIKQLYGSTVNIEQTEEYNNYATNTKTKKKKKQIKKTPQKRVYPIGTNNTNTSRTASSDHLRYRLRSAVSHAQNTAPKPLPNANKRRGFFGKKRSHNNLINDDDEEEWLPPSKKRRTK